MARNAVEQATNVGRSGFQFEGFSSPNGTLVPDELFDLLAPQLSEAELRVCLYIIRRTFGFKKQSDDISLRQMVEGIRTRDGRVLDHGAGVVKSAAARAVKGLVAKGVVIAVRNRSADRGFEPTTYTLRFKQVGDAPEPGVPHGNPMSSRRTRDVLERDRPMSSKGTDKKQFLQETASSKGERASRARHSTEERAQLDQVMDELSEKLDDQEHAASNRTQVRNLLEASGLAEQQLVGRMYEALSVTKDRARDGNLKTKAPYFFAVLRDLLGGQEPRPEGAAETLATSSHSDGKPTPQGPSSEAPPAATSDSVPGHMIPGTTLTTSEAWGKALDLLASEVSPTVLRTYFARTQLRDVDDRNAVVVATNGYVAEQLTRRFRESVARALSLVIGKAVSVAFEPASAGPMRTPVSPLNRHERYGRPHGGHPPRTLTQP